MLRNTLEHNESIELSQALALSKYFFQLAQQAQYTLSNEMYNCLGKHNITLAKYGNSEQKLNHYHLILDGVNHTFDGTDAHGHYLTLAQHFSTLCKRRGYDIDQAIKDHYPFARLIHCSAPAV